jgi:hypothetical protein
MQTWRLAYNNLHAGSAYYTVISTVPDSDILKASDDVNSKISTTTVNMIIALVLCLAFVILVVVVASYFLVQTIVNPILELKGILGMVISGDLNATIPTVASSYDMKILLEAFVSFMVALRFGNDNYARGDTERALAAYRDALQLYTLAGNKYGIASAHNNIAAACLETGNYTLAEKHFLEAIKLGEEMLVSMAEPQKGGEEDAAEQARAIQRMKRTLSDRKGNLVVLRLRQDDFPGAFALLEQLLSSDKQDNYVMGCIVKQGILGHYYLKQDELVSAERVFNSALDFIRAKDSELFNESWNLTETQVAEQVQGYC